MLTHRHRTILGDIPADWDAKPLKSLIADQFAGDWGDDEGEQAVAVLRSTNFTNDGHLDFSDIARRYFPKVEADQFGLLEGDLLVERSGGGPEQPVGRIGFIERDMPGATVSNFVQVLRPDAEEVDASFLGWALFELQRTGIVERVQQQSTQMRNLNWRDYQRLLLPWPGLEEQRRIAAVLGAADEAVKKARAERVAAQELRASLLLQLFTDPANKWEQTKFSTLISEPIRNGYSPVCPQDPTGAWVLGLDALTDSGFNAAGAKPAPIQDQGLLPFRLELNDILISRSNTPELVGRVGRYTGNPEHAYYPDLMMRIRVISARVLPEFAELLLRSAVGRQWIKSRASGTSGSMVKIKRRDIMTMPVRLPRPAEQEAIVAAVSASSAAIAASQEKELQLRELGKCLLQNLLTGKVRIPEGATHV